jgi:sugar lactone lactonase YvrE
MQMNATELHNDVAIATRARGIAKRAECLLSLAALVVVCSAPYSAAQSTTFPEPVVASTTTTLGTGLNQPQGVDVDAAGDVFVASAGGGNVVEFPANGGPSVTIMSGLNYNKGLTVDSSGNVYSTSFNGNIEKWPAGGSTNSASSFTTGSSCPDFAAMGYYIGFFDLSADAKGNIYALGGNDYILEFDQQGNCTERLTPTQLSSAPGGVASGAAGDLYYSLGSTIYYVPVGSTTPTPLAIASGAVQTINALTVDANGNLFITDQASIDEIPMVNGTLQPADLTYLVPSGAAFNIGISPAGVLYSGNFNANSVVRTVLGSLALGASNVEAAGTPGVLTYTFNAAVAPTGFGFTSPQFAATSASTCAAGTAYPASTASAISTCALDVALTAATPGKITGAVQFDTASGALATTYLSGNGEGAALTVDPGTQTSLSSFTTPSAVAVDAGGDVFVADSEKNTVTELPAGGGTAVTLGSGLNAPQGLALDPAGDLFIADTGNDRVVEIPMVSGSLSTAAQAVVASSLSAPMGVATDLAGNVLIANSGAGNVLELPNQGGVIGMLSPFAIGSGLKKPTAIAVDANGNIFIADETAADVVELTPTGQQSTVLANISQIVGLAVDANDDLFLTQSGIMSVTKIAMVSGAYATNATVALGTGLSGPQGIAIDTAGDLFIADPAGAAAYELQRTVGSLSFGKLNIGDTSASQTLTLSNSGNQALTFVSPLFTPVSGDTGDFAVTAAANNGCDAPLATGVSCGLSASFTPTASGARTEMVGFQSNASNASVIQASLSGTGSNAAPTTLNLTLLPAGTINFGQTLSVTTTIAPKTASTVTPTGTAQFSVDGSNYGAPVTLSSTGTATTSITGLNGGPHDIDATYSGDTVYASSSASSPLNLTIAAAPTATKLTSTISGSTAVATGTSVTFTATAAPSGFSAPPNPSGTVSFYQAGNSTALGTAPLTNGVATFTTTSLPNGQYNVTAVYSGDTDFSTSTSAGYAVYISPPTFVLSNTPTSLTVSKQGSASLTFTVAGIAGYQGTAVPSCSGLPQNAMCSFTPGGVNFLVTSGPQTVTLTVQTGVNSSFASMYLLPSLALLAGLFLMNRRRRLPKLLLIVLVLAAGAVAGSSLTGCSTGSSPSTASGSSTVVVQVVGSSAAPDGTTIKQSFSFNLQVQ